MYCSSFKQCFDKTGREVLEESHGCIHMTVPSGLFLTSHATLKSYKKWLSTLVLAREDSVFPLQGDVSRHLGEVACNMTVVQRILLNEPIVTILTGNGKHVLQCPKHDYDLGVRRLMWKAVLVRVACLVSDLAALRWLCWSLGTTVAGALWQWRWVRLRVCFASWNIMVSGFSKIYGRSEMEIKSGYIQPSADYRQRSIHFATWLLFFWCSDLMTSAACGTFPKFLMTASKIWLLHFGELTTFFTMTSGNDSKATDRHLSISFWWTVTVYSTSLISASWT